MVVSRVSLRTAAADATLALPLAVPDIARAQGKFEASYGIQSRAFRRAKRGGRPAVASRQRSADPAAAARASGTLDVPRAKSSLHA